MLELIAVLGAVGALFFLAKKSGDAQKPKEQPGEGGTVASLLNFVPFRLVTRQNATVQVLSRSGLPPQTIGQLVAARWGLNPRTLPTLLQQGLPIPGAAQGSADLWQVDAAYTGPTTDYSPDSVLAKILSGGVIPPQAVAATPVSSPRALATILLLSSQSPSVADAVTIPIRKVR